MRKGTYYIANFHAHSLKNPLSILTRNVLRKTERVFEMFDIYADESCENSPRKILQNLTQKNEAVFVSNTSFKGQSNRELSSPMKAEASSSGLPRKQLPSVDTPTEAFEPSNIDLSAEGEPMDTATTAELATKDHEAAGTSKEDIKDLMRDNRVQIKSVSIIRQSGDIGVEINIDLLRGQDASSLKEGYVSTRKSSSPSRAERKSDSPSAIASKSPAKSSILSESSPTVDYSDPSMLEFLTNKLLNNLTCRKRCLNQIYNCFVKFKEDVKEFSNTIMDLKLVVEKLPMAKEKYFTEDLKKLRKDQINEATKMQIKAKSLIADVENDIAVWENCIHQIENLEKDFELLLTSKDESVINLSELKRLETSLKEICAKADATVILKDGRREILLETSPIFECLIKNFVKFLIITEMLTAVSEADEEK